LARVEVSLRDGICLGRVVGSHGEVCGSGEDICWGGSIRDAREVEEDTKAGFLVLVYVQKPDDRVTAVTSGEGDLCATKELCRRTELEDSPVERRSRQLRNVI
jgi:hypothetical protein